MAWRGQGIVRGPQGPRMVDPLQPLCGTQDRGWPVVKCITLHVPKIEVFGRFTENEILNVFIFSKETGLKIQNIKFKIFLAVLCEILVQNSRKIGFSRFSNVQLHVNYAPYAPMLEYANQKCPLRPSRTTKKHEKKIGEGPLPC